MNQRNPLKAALAMTCIAGGYWLVGLSRSEGRNTTVQPSAGARAEEMRAEETGDFDVPVRVTVSQRGTLVTSVNLDGVPGACRDIPIIASVGGNVVWSGLHDGGRFRKGDSAPGEAVITGGHYTLAHEAKTTIARDTENSVGRQGERGVI